MAHEIDYPSDNEKGTGHGSTPELLDRSLNKNEDDDQSLAEDSYFSGEQYIQAKNIEPVTASNRPMGLSVTEVHERTDDIDNDQIALYDEQLIDDEGLNFMGSESVWHGFVSRTNELITSGDRKQYGRSQLHEICMDDDQRGSVRSIGVGITSDDMGTEVQEGMVGCSNENNISHFCNLDVSFGPSRPSHHESDNKYINRSNRDEKGVNKQDSSGAVDGNDDTAGARIKYLPGGGFSFIPSQIDGEQAHIGSSKSLWSNKSHDVVSNNNSEHLNALVRSGDMLALRPKSTDSSPTKSSRDGKNTNSVRSASSIPSSASNYDYIERGHSKKVDGENASTLREEDPEASLDEEEAVAVQEQVRQIKAQEEEFETFDLKIVHRKNRYLVLY